MIDLFRFNNVCQGLYDFPGVLVQLLVPSAFIPLLRPPAHLDMIFYMSPDDVLRDGFTHRDYKDAGLFVIGNDDGSRGVIFP